MSFLRGDYIQNEIVAQAGDHVGDLALSEDEHCRSLRFEIVELRRVEEGSIGVPGGSNISAVSSTTSRLA